MCHELLQPFCVERHCQSIISDVKMLKEHPKGCHYGWVDPHGVLENLNNCIANDQAVIVVDSRGDHIVHFWEWNLHIHYYTSADDTSWCLWLAFCASLNFGYAMQLCFQDTNPMWFQLFAQHFCFRLLLATSCHAVHARTVEDTVQAVGQMHVRLVGSSDPRLNAHYAMEICLTTTLNRAWQHCNVPLRVKPFPLHVIA